MDFIDPGLLSYSESHTAPEDALLAELNRQTHLKVSSPRMLSGHLQGRFLSLISTLMQPSLIVEVGTYTGYSALCLAEGLAPGGRLITIDPNEETNEFARSFFERSQFSSSITLMEGSAVDQIPKLSDGIDLAFIDADKEGYIRYYDLLLPKMRKGGLIIADNVLWSGKVLTNDNSSGTLAIKAFNDYFAADSRVTPLVLPLRDGIALLRKK
jgi:caffeoyl-CoA O-methyltransferase